MPPSGLLFLDGPDQLVFKTSGFVSNRQLLFVNNLSKFPASDVGFVMFRVIGQSVVQIVFESFL